MSFPRYPEYKNSGVEWLENVPKHWDVVPLKYLASLKGRLGWQGLNPNATMKCSGVEWFGDVPEHWEVKPLKHSIGQIDVRGLVKAEAA